MKRITLLFLLVSNFCFSQNAYIWVQDGDMNVNGTQSRWRRQLIDTSKIDTTFVNADSAIKNSFGQIIGWRNGKKINIFKENPKPLPKGNDSSYFLIMDTAFHSIILREADTIRYLYDKNTTVKKKGKKVVKRIPAKKKPAAPGKPKQPTYFVGSGLVTDQFGDYVIIKFPQGYFTKKKPNQKT